MRQIANKTLADVGLDKDAMDSTVDPCQDFYQYACGTWIAKTEIPKTDSRWLRSFSGIQERNYSMTADLLRKASVDPGRDPISQRVGDFFAACMDEEAVEAAGTRPIQSLLEKARMVASGKQIAALVGELHRRRIWALFDVNASANVRTGVTMVAWIDQNGFGLPNRDYYINDDARSRHTRDVYKAHIDAMMKLVGLSPAASQSAAADVMRVETELAKLSRTATQGRDPKSLFNKVDRPALAKLAPQFDWNTYFATIGLASITEVDLGSLSFFDGMGKTLGSTSLDALRNYLRWRIVSSMTSALPKAFREEQAKLGKVLYGTRAPQPRDRQCVRATDEALRDWVGALFARSQTFDSRPEVMRISRAIVQAFEEELGLLPWMDDQTKQGASSKLRAMQVLIGTPEQPRNYDFPVDSKAFANNVLSARAFDTDRRLARVGKPLDRKDWPMSTIVASAGYTHDLNVITVTLGQLQPPYFDARASLAVNCGSTGFTIGHELTHGFDDYGAQYDETGRLFNWWQPAALQKYKEGGRCVVKQFDEFEPLPGLKLDGALTLGENIADLGGVKLAFRAYRAMRADAAEPIIADGFDEDRQFFLSYAQSWCGKYRDEYLRDTVATELHAPAKYRVNGPLSNLPEFAEAFSCARGSPMAPSARCSVW